MKLIQLALGVFLAFAVMGSVQAKDPGRGQGQGPAMQSRLQPQQIQQLQYRNIDTNGDGKITPEEVQAHERLTEQMRKQWSTADKNNDGEVDKAEFSAFRERVNEQVQKEQKEQQMQHGTEEEESGD